jgi:hypothetical protein
MHLLTASFDALKLNSSFKPIGYITALGASRQSRRSPTAVNTSKSLVLRTCQHTILVRYDITNSPGSDYDTIGDFTCRSAIIGHIYGIFLIILRQIVTIAHFFKIDKRKPLDPNPLNESKLG